MAKNGTSFRPGHRVGRTKGAKNKVTASMREAFKEAFDGMGGVEALMEWGKKNPNLFYPLASKLIPIQLTGEDGKAIEVDFK